MSENAIVPVNRTMPAVPTLDKVQAVQALVTMACKSGMSKAKNPADAFFIAMYGIELGIPPITALRTIYSVQGGAPTCSGEAMLSLLRGSGKVKIAVPDPATVKDSATVKITRIDTGETGEFTFTMEMANRAGLMRSGGNWTKYPQMMLIWRAVSMGAKLLCSDIIGGLYTYEEINPELAVDETGAPIIDAEYTEVIDTPEPPPPTPPAQKDQRNADAWNMTELVAATKHLYANDFEQTNSLKKHTSGDTPLIPVNISTERAISLLVAYKTRQAFEAHETAIDTDAELAAFIYSALDMSYSEWVKSGKSHEEAWKLIKFAIAVKFDEVEDTPF